jgi:hypothetical protein
VPVLRTPDKQTKFTTVIILSLTSREEHRLRLFEDIVLRNKFVPKKEQVEGTQSRPHNEDLYDPYSSTNIIRAIKLRRMRWAGHAARIGDTRDVYSALVEKTDGKQPLGGSKCRWGMILEYIFKKWDGKA